MAFQPTGPGARTVRVKIQKNKAGKFRWTTRGDTHGLKWFGESIEAQRDAVSTYGRDIAITDEHGRERYIS